MAAFKLKDLENLDEAIQIEHREWLRNARLEENFGIKLRTSVKNERYSLLKFPKLWSGNRVGETSIESDPNVIPIDFLGVISRQKQKYRSDWRDEEVLRLEKLEDDYKKFLEHLKERFLAQAIKITLNSLPESEAKIDLKKFYKNAERSPVNLQTQDQCVAEHAKITLAIQKARKSILLENRGDDALQQLEQLEILSKRRVDIHYENPTKKTTADVVTSGISATSSTLGMVTALGAAALWIGGFIFPPLWIGAAILGAISFVSYVSTAISVGKVVRNGINGRPPSRSEVKDLAIEAALAPLNVFGKIFRGVRHFVKSSRVVESVLRKIKDVGTNFLSNITDAPWVKDNIEGAKDAVSDAKEHRTSKNDTTMTSTAKVMSELLKTQPVSKASEYATDLDNAISKNKTPVFMQLKTVKGEIPELDTLQLTTQPSVHASISDWSFGFRTSIKYKTELQPIQAALDDYKKLPVNATYEARASGLHSILFECQNYQNTTGKKPVLSAKIKELQGIVNTELSNLEVIAQNEDLQTSRPLLIGR